VSRVYQGLPPSCPQCRDSLGACLETCIPLMVRRDFGVASSAAVATAAPTTTAPPTASRLAGIKTFERTVAAAVREALGESAESRVLVVAAPGRADALCRSGWLAVACEPGGMFERLAGSSACVHKALERFRSGSRRVMVVEGGATNEVGVRMPWVTHVVMLDERCRSTHWVMRTSASPVGIGGASIDSGCGQGGGNRTVVVKRVVPAALMLGKRIRRN